MLIYPETCKKKQQKLRWRKKMKKFIKSLSLVLASSLILASCSAGNTNSEKTTDANAAGQTTKADAKNTTVDKVSEGAKGEIHVYSRDESSGTRGAFQDIIGYGDTEKNQEVLTDKAVIEDSNGALAKAVGSDKNSIGFVSMTTDFEANNIKGLSFEGVEPSAETVLDNSYALKRPFNMVSRAAGDFADEKTEALVDAFVDFLLNSVEGRDAVASAGGIVDVDGGKKWDDLKANHPIVNEDNSSLIIRTAGSTSVEKALQAALEAFVPLAGNFKFVSAHTGSSDGYKRVLGEEKDGANAADLGFASRDFKDSEKVADGKHSGVFAQDAVVVAVASANAISNLSKDQVHDIFTGKITTWEELAK